MNKIISTKERIFISLVGPSGSGKSHLIHDWLIIGTFQPDFDKIYDFYQHYQSLYGLPKTLRTFNFFKELTLSSFRVYPIMEQSIC